ncbi:MAG: hypothetical protein HZA93_25620 [Verrucomicrobia bacterium]|nr:hypothetical protein [Verrucomicrobiota bacterium]
MAQLKPKLPTERDPNPRRPITPEPGCFTGSESHRSLVLSPGDADTAGFPLTWLYRWQWKIQTTHELLTLTLTEHEVTITGLNLGLAVEHLTSGKGFHLRVKDDRYQSLLGSNEIRITSITIQPHPKNSPPPN